MTSLPCERCHSFPAFLGAWLVSTTEYPRRLLTAAALLTGTAKARPKAPAQNLDEMDAGTDGLDQAFLQIKKNDQELDQELDLVHQGVKRLGVMAQDMNVITHANLQLLVTARSSLTDSL